MHAGELGLKIESATATTSQEPARGLERLSRPERIAVGSVIQLKMAVEALTRSRPIPLSQRESNRDQSEGVGPAIGKGRILSRGIKVAASVQHGVEGEERVKIQTDKSSPVALQQLSEESKPSLIVPIADICGVVFRRDNGQPLADVEIDAGVLGVATTDKGGTFVIRNVPLNTSYELVPRTPGLSFAPEKIVGVCCETNFERFVVGVG